MTERQVIIAPQGQVRQTLVVLLGLAQRPQDVHYPGNGREIEVPDYLMDAYIKATAPPRKRAAKKTPEED